MLSRVLTGFGVAAAITVGAGARGDDLPASDWITTGPDCSVFAGGDVDGDGFADLLTINGNRDLCWAPSVRGWKSSSWRALLHDVNPAALGLGVLGATGATGTTRVIVVEADKVTLIPVGPGGKPGERVVVAAGEGRVFTGLGLGRACGVRDQEGKFWIITEQNTLVAAEADWKEAAGGVALSPPPYDPAAKSICRFESGFAREGGRLEWEVFDTKLPHPHRVVRNAVVQSPDPNDSDADGLTDEEERAIGTDPHCRDSDGDGLLDGWEVHGLPRGVDLGQRISLFNASASQEQRDAQLDPRRKDAIVSISYFEQVDRKKFAEEMPRVQKAYRDLHTANPDGTSGVWLHFIEIPEGVPVADQKMAWWDVGNKYFPKGGRGLLHWMQVTPWGGGQSSETGDMGGCGNNWAVFAHELGHQLSLSHTGDSSPGWCPLYTSMMNYAYSYSFDGDGSRPHFSTGEFRDAVLDEHHLIEKLPFLYERLKFLANRPFRFLLKDNGDGTTLIDWNQNGAFDEGEVVADINYGGSTHAGERKTHTLIGSAPSLAYIGGKCFIAAATHKQNAVTVKMHRGNEEWTGEAEVGSSSTRSDPVLIGGPRYGVLLVRRFDCWSVGTVRGGEKEGDPPRVSGLAALADLTTPDVSGIRIGERVLVVARHDTGALETRWLSVPESGEKPVLGEAKGLTLVSMVPVGMAAEGNGTDGTKRTDRTVTVVSSNRHAKHGPYTMQVSSLKVVGDEVTETAAEWTHGGRPCHCTSRPVVVYPDSGGKPQMTIFHTGWTDGNGCWTGWRTKRIGNLAVDDGWLTSEMYDQWTRSRVALGFADGPDGAFYAFRWDPGDHRDWKVNTMFVARGGYGLDDAPMRDFDDGAKIGDWGIRHSILTMPVDAEVK